MGVNQESMFRKLFWLSTVDSDLHRDSRCIWNTMKPYRKGPYDATYAERELIRLVYDREITIDENGRIWRIGIRHNNRVFPIEARRAENKTRDGYLEFRSMRDGERKYVQAHRLVWQYFNGDIPEGYTINHINGIVDDNRPSNLELATMSEQNIHASKIGKKNYRGERNSNATLTEKQVEQIRFLAKTGMLQKDIARQYGVSRGQVSKIVNGKSWPT